MNVRFLSNSLIGPIVFFAAVIALLTQLQIHKKVHAIFGVEYPVLLAGHRWAGRIALGGFVLKRMMGLFSDSCSTYGDTCLAFPFKPQHLTHGALSALCAAAVVSKIRVTQRRARRRTRGVLAWRATSFFLGASFFILTCVLAAWRWANPSVIWGKTEWLIYKAATLGHVGLAIALIGLGRLALASRHRLDRTGTFVELRVMEGVSLPEITEAEVS